MTVQLDALPELLGLVLGARPAPVADGWRHVAATSPGLAAHPADGDGWIRFDLGGVTFCEIHADTLAPDATRGLARIRVDGEWQLLDLVAPEQGAAGE